MRFWFICGFFSLLLAGMGAQAQQEKPVRVEILALSLDGNVKDLKFRNGREISSLDVYWRGITGPFKYEGPPTIGFFRDVTAITAPSLENPVPPVATAKIPSGAAKVLLLFRKDSAGGDESYTVNAINYNVADFPDGGYRFFNFSSLEINGTMAEKRFYVRPGGIATLKQVVSGNPPNVLTKMAIKEGKGWKLIYSAPWGYHPKRRVSVVILPGQTSQSPIEVRKFNEIQPPDPDEEKKKGRS